MSEKAKKLAGRKNKRGAATQQREPAAPAPPSAGGGGGGGGRVPYDMFLRSSFDRPSEFESVVAPETGLYSVYAVYDDGSRHLVCKGMRSGKLANLCADVARCVRAAADKECDNVAAVTQHIRAMWSMFEAALSEQRTDHVYGTNMALEEARQRAPAMLAQTVRAVPLDAFGDACIARRDVQAFYVVPAQASTYVYARVVGVADPVLCKALGSGKTLEASRLVARFRALANSQTLPHDIDFLGCQPLTRAERAAGGVGELEELASRTGDASVEAQREFAAGDDVEALTEEQFSKAQTVADIVRRVTEAANGADVVVEKADDGNIVIKADGDGDDDAASKPAAAPITATFIEKAE